MITEVNKIRGHLLGAYRETYKTLIWIDLSHSCTTNNVYIVEKTLVYSCSITILSWWVQAWSWQHNRRGLQKRMTAHLRSQAEIKTPLEMINNKHKIQIGNYKTNLTGFQKHNRNEKCKGWLQWRAWWQKSKITDLQHMDDRHFLELAKTSRINIIIQHIKTIVQ